MNQVLLLLLPACVLEGCLGLLMLRFMMPAFPEERPDNGFLTLKPELRSGGLTAVKLAMFATTLLSGVKLAFDGFPLLYALGLICLEVLLWVCTWSDLNVCLVPNRVIAVGLLERAVLYAAEVLKTPGDALYLAVNCLAAAAVVTAAGLLCRLVSSGSLGFGDIKLMLCMGLFLGMEMTWNAMLCAMIVMFVTSVLLLLTKKVNRNSGLPFAPALLAGTLLAILL